MTEAKPTVSKEKWAATAVHKASTYSCAKCGRQFASPDALYVHLDAEHPRKKAQR